MSSELAEALGVLGATALVPKYIDPTLLELQRRYSPLVRSIPSFQFRGNTYYFDTRTSVVAGGFVPDGGARPISSSVYNQSGFDMTHVEELGAVTGYAQEVATAVGDLRQTEIMGAYEGYYWDVEWGMVWGNAASTRVSGAQPQFDGLDSQVNDFTSGYKNSLDKAGGTFTLAYLDELIDCVESNASMPVFDASWMLVMSSTASSKIAQLQTPQQRFTDVEVATGLVVPSYRNIPIIKTSFLSSRGYQMSTISSATTTTGGSLPASTTYKYVIAPVISRQAETMQSNEVSQATGSGTATNAVVLSFTPPSGQDGASPALYKVYRTAAGGSAGTETFLGYVDATVGLAADGVTPIVANQIVDTGTYLLPQNSVGPVIPANTPAGYFGTNANMFPVGVASAPTENIYLISRRREFVCRPYVRDAKPVDVYPTTAAPDSLPFAIIGDTTFAVKAPRFCGRMSRVSMSL